MLIQQINFLKISDVYYFSLDQLLILIFIMGAIVMNIRGVASGILEYMARKISIQFHWLGVFIAVAKLILRSQKLRMLTSLSLKVSNLPFINLTYTIYGYRLIIYKSTLTNGFLDIGASDASETTTSRWRHVLDLCLPHIITETFTNRTVLTQ